MHSTTKTSENIMQIEYFSILASLHNFYNTQRTKFSREFAWMPSKKTKNKSKSIVKCLLWLFLKIKESIFPSIGLLLCSWIQWIQNMISKKRGSSFKMNMVHLVLHNNRAFCLFIQIQIHSGNSIVSRLIITICKRKKRRRMEINEYRYYDLFQWNFIMNSTLLSLSNLALFTWFAQEFPVSTEECSFCLNKI